MLGARELEHCGEVEEEDGVGPAAAYCFEVCGDLEADFRKSSEHDGHMKVRGEGAVRR